MCLGSNVFMFAFIDQGEVWERMQGMFFLIHILNIGHAAYNIIELILVPL